jgi:YVTN family beta-propeller protein
LFEIGKITRARSLVKREKIIRSGVVFLVLIVGIGISVYLAPKATIRLRCINWHEKILPGLKTDRDYLFVAMGVCNSVLAIDTTAHEVAAAVKIDGKFPHGIAATPDRKYIYAANERSDDLTVISVDGFRVVKTIAVDEFPTDVVPSMDGRKVYVSNIDSGTVSVIDVERQEVVKEIVTKGTPQHVAMDRGGRMLYVTNPEREGLQVIDTFTNSVIRDIYTGPDPQQIAPRYLSYMR